MADFNFKKLSLIVAGGSIVIAGGIIGSSAMLSRSSVSLKTKTVSTMATEKTITVKGVAEKQIVSDLGAREVEIFCNAKEIPAGYAQINEQNKLFLKKLTAIGIDESKVEDVQITYFPVYKNIEETKEKKTVTRQEFQHYRFRRGCRIVTSDVKALAKASVELYDLIAAGVEISISKPQYFISDPEQYKMQLIDSATASAYQRANTLAVKSGAELGPLLVARQGVIQITRTASNDTSDYGMYDTSSINKVMRLVVTLEYSLKR